MAVRSLGQFMIPLVLYLGVITLLNILLTFTAFNCSLSLLQWSGITQMITANVNLMM